MATPGSNKTGQEHVADMEEQIPVTNEVAVGSVPNDRVSNSAQETQAADAEPRLSYMDELRLAKFARSHRNLATFLQADSSRAFGSQPAGANVQAATNVKLPRRFLRDSSCSLRLQDFETHAAAEVCGGQDLNDTGILRKDAIWTGSVENAVDQTGGQTTHHPPDIQRLNDDNETYRRLSQILVTSDVGGRRSNFVAHAADWHSFRSLDENETALGDDHDGVHGHFHAPFYDYPVQRQRWGDPQLLPHINWGDLFFDLFYVGIAYNLGTLLISVLTSNEWQRGMVYFFGIFGPLYNMWERKMNYEARYVVLDYAHRVLEVVRVFLLGFAALHIKSVALLKDPKSIETFALCISIFLEASVYILLKVELIVVGRGDRIAIANHTKRTLYKSLIPVAVFYLAATIVSGVLFFGPYSEKKTNLSQGNNFTDAYDDSHHRHLAEESHSFNSDSSSMVWSLGDLPLALCCASYLFDIIFSAFRKLCKFDPKKLDIRDHYIPTNIDFQIHRYGEFIMLMLGESVLSLLIVEPTELSHYYVTACVGIVTVIFLQALKFDSEPSNADNHCLWRGVKASYVYSLLIQLLSVSLIGFGVSFKVMLATIYKEGDYYNADEENRRFRALVALPEITFLAIKCLYCGSLTAVLVSIELLASSHKGFREQYRLFLSHDKTGYRNIHWRVVLVTSVKLLLLLFIATLPLWLRNHRALTGLGLAVTVVFTVLRIIDWGVETDHHGVKKIIHAVNIASQIGHLKDISSKAVSFTGSAFSSSLPTRKCEGGAVTLSAHHASPLVEDIEEEMDSEPL
jgi:Bacterial low temperature requirement A protein (LtrA)